MMNDILGDLIHIEYVMVYLDDILIFGMNKKEHRQLVKKVLKRLQENDLYAKAEKCSFEQSNIKYLSVIISENKGQIDEEKLSGVLEQPVPTKFKQVQAFLGFANFYQRFIENFAKMSKLLSDLIKKYSIQTWGIEQQNTFEVWKRAFITAPVLKIPNDEDLFKLSTDVSNFATSAVLSQKILTTGLWHSLTFFSKLLYIYERNYKIYNKELLAIIRRLEEYHYHLEGHLHKIEI